MVKSNPLAHDLSRSKKKELFGTGAFNKREKKKR